MVGLALLFRAACRCNARADGRQPCIEPCNRSRQLRVRYLREIVATDIDILRNVMDRHIPVAYRVALVVLEHVRDLGAVQLLVMRHVVREGAVLRHRYTHGPDRAGVRM